MSYSRGLPLMVIVEAGLKSEGLLERGNDWYVQSMKLEAASLQSNEFNGVLASWRERVIKGPRKGAFAKTPSELTVAELIGGLKPVQLWSVLGALAALATGAFALGGQLVGGRREPVHSLPASSLATSGPQSATYQGIVNAMKGNDPPKVFNAEVHLNIDGPEVTGTYWNDTGDRGLLTASLIDNRLFGEVTSNTLARSCCVKGGVGPNRESMDATYVCPDGETGELNLHRVNLTAFK